MYLNSRANQGTTNANEEKRINAETDSRLTNQVKARLKQTEPTNALTTSPHKYRVGCLRNNLSGRRWSRGHVCSMSTPSSRRCIYQTVPGRSGWPSRDPMEEDGGGNLYAFVLNDPVYTVDYLGLDNMKNCHRVTVQIDLKKFIDPFSRKEESYGSAFIKADYIQCEICCNGVKRKQHRLDVVVAGAELKLVSRPILAIPSLYVGLFVQVGGSIAYQSDPCPKNTTINGAINLQISARVGFDSIAGGLFDIYGEGGGTGRLGISEDSLTGRPRLLLGAQVFVRATAKINITKKLSARYAWQKQISSSDKDIYDF